MLSGFPMGSPVPASQILAVPSAEAVTTFLPSRLKSTSKIASVCPLSLALKACESLCPHLGYDLETTITRVRRR